MEADAYIISFVTHHDENFGSNKTPSTLADIRSPKTLTFGATLSSWTNQSKYNQYAMLITQVNASNTDH